MAYNSTTGIISAPVSIYDLQQAVPAILQRTNSSTGDVEVIASSDLGVLCSKDVGDTIPASDGNGNWMVIQRTPINMWAKFKPVRSYQSGLLDTVSQLSNGVWNNALSSQWWRDTVNAAGLRIGYGINPIRRTGSADGLADLFQAYQAGIQWSHIRPNGVDLGGSTYPYRLLDFHQYNNKAPQPLGSISAPSSLILTTGEAWSIDVSMMINQDDEEPVANRDYVTPEDILKQVWVDENDNPACYFGFALMDSNGVAKIWVTGNRYYGVGNNGSRLSEGTYTIMPFYTNRLLPQDESLGNLNPGPSTIPSGTAFATVPNVECPQLVIPNGSVQRDDARWSVKAVLQSGVCKVTAKADATPLQVTGGTVLFDGGKYPQVVIYVCKEGTTVGVGLPDANDILDSRSFYSQQNLFEVQGGSSGESKTVGGAQQNFYINEEKCRVFVYAGNGSQYDTGMTARAQGDAMISSGTIVPGDEPVLTT